MTTMLVASLIVIIILLLFITECTLAAERKLIKVLRLLTTISDKLDEILGD